jgi:hypothetical protein
MNKRVVICHYHIFKNSGTSFDVLLTRNFGENHILFDGPFPFFVIDQIQLTRIIERKMEIVAFSSHQIRLPPPTSLDFVVLPVIFIRHPVLRIRSIFKFKRETEDGTTTSRAARAMTFDQWVTYSLTNLQEIGHISNAQTSLLSSTDRQLPLKRKTKTGLEYDIHQAIRNINSVQLLGRTEYYDEDVMRFPQILAQYGVSFKYEKLDPENVTSLDHRKPLNERIDKIRKLLSKENFDKLLEVNSQDLYIFDYITQLLSEKR